MRLKSKLNYAFKSYQHYLTNPCNDKFLVTSWTKEEILVETLSIYNNYKASGPSSISFKILKTAKHSIANQWCQVFNLYFWYLPWMLGSF